MIGDAIQRNETSEFRFDIGKVAMIGVCVMVLVSGYTTAKGLLDIVGWGQFYVVVMAAAVVQGMLAIAAWFLGQELARYVLRSRLRTGIEPPSAPLTAVTAIVFVATFLASFFFAFSFWFTELRNLSQRTEDARQLPNSFQIAVMTNLRDAVKAGRENELRNPAQDPVIGPWLANLGRIESIAQGGARTQIEAQLADIRNKDQKAARDLQDSLALRETNIKDANTKLADARKLKAAAQSEIETIKQRLAPFDDELVPLRAKYDEHETERLKECAGIQKRKEGCGPKAKAAGIARDAAKRRIDVIEAQAKPDRSRLTVLEKQVRDANAAIETQTSALANLGVAREQDAPASNTANVPTPPRLDTLDQALKELAALRQAFLAQGTPEAYRAAVGACTSILRPLNEAKIAADQLSQLSCESSGVLQLSQTRPAREEARKGFDQACSAAQMTEAANRATDLIPHGQQRVPAELLGRSFDQMNAKIQSCINIAATTGAQVSAAEGIRAEFARGNAPDRDRFQEALNGLATGGGHRNAAAGIAAIFDLMILALSFFADLFKIRGHAGNQGNLVRYPNVDTTRHDGDPVPLAGAKALRRITRYDVNSKQSIFDPDAPGVQNQDSDIRDNMFQRLDHFLQERQADQLKDRRYVLSEEALSALEVYIEQQRRAESHPAGESDGLGPQLTSPEEPAIPANAPLYDRRHTQDRRAELANPQRPGQQRHVNVQPRPVRSGAPWQRPARQRPPSQVAPSAEAHAVGDATAVQTPVPENVGADFGIASLMRRGRDN